MTEEERQRAWAEQLRKVQDRVAMLSQSAMTPEELAQLTEQAGYDPSGKEAMLATMLRGGQDAVFGDMPQGKQIGDIYVAPTWSESLNAAAQKVVGGYQAGQARREQKEIDAQRAQAATAQEQIDAEAARVKSLGQAQSDLADMVDTEADNARDERRLTQAAEIARLNREAADKRHGLTLAAANARAQAKLDAEGGNTGPVGKLTAKRRVLKADGTPMWIGQDKYGDTYDEAGNPIEDPSTLQDALNETQIRTGLSDLNTRMEDVQPLVNAIEQYDAALQPYTLDGEKESEYGDIPGQGQFSRGEGPIGYAARMGEKLDAMLSGGDTSEPERIYAMARNVGNIKLRQGAGLSQTVAEIERLRPVLTGELGTDPSVVRQAMDSIKSALQADLANLKAGTHPQIIGAYESAAGKSSMFNKQFTPLKFKGDAPAQKSLADYTDAELDAMTPEELERLLNGG